MADVNNPSYFVDKSRMHTNPKIVSLNILRQLGNCFEWRQKRRTVCWISPVAGRVRDHYDRKRGRRKVFGRPVPLRGQSHFIRRQGSYLIRVCQYIYHRTAKHSKDGIGARNSNCLSAPIRTARLAHLRHPTDDDASSDSRCRCLSV